jgi:hypothetical protein
MTHVTSHWSIHAEIGSVVVPGAVGGEGIAAA